MTDIVEQCRQHVASFEAIGGTGAYPFSVLLAKHVLLQQAEIERLRPYSRESVLEAEMEARAIASIEGQNWTDTPLTDHDKNLIGMTVDFVLSHSRVSPTESRG